MLRRLPLLMVSMRCASDGRVEIESSRLRGHAPLSSSSDEVVQPKAHLGEGTGADVVRRVPATLDDWAASLLWMLLKVHRGPLLTLTRLNPNNPIPEPEPSLTRTLLWMLRKVYRGPWCFGAYGAALDDPDDWTKVRWTESDGRRLRVASDAARALVGRAGCPCTVQLGLEFVFGPPPLDLRLDGWNAFASAQATAVTPSANEHRAELESQRLSDLSDLRAVIVASATVSHDSGSTASGSVLLQLESAG